MIVEYLYRVWHVGNAPEHEEVGTRRAFYLMSAREKMAAKPVETPKEPECERILDMPCPFWLRNSVI